MRQKEMAAPSPHPPPLPFASATSSIEDVTGGAVPSHVDQVALSAQGTGAGQRPVPGLCASAWRLSRGSYRQPTTVVPAGPGGRRRDGHGGEGRGGARAARVGGGGRELRGQRVGGGLGSNKCNHGRAPQGSLISRARDARARFKGAFNRARSWAPSPHITGANRFVHILGRARPGPPAASRGRGRG